MKIVVLQGDNTARARARYSQIVSGVKKRGWDVVEVDPKRKLAEQLVSTDLFTSDILYTIDGIRGVNSRDIEWLAKNSSKYDGSLLIYIEGKLPAPAKKVLPKSIKIETFELPVLLWQFIDSFYPGNSKRCLYLLEELLKKEPVELLIALLARKLRDYYRGNSNKFTKELLVDTIDSLAELDYKSKTSDVNAKLLLEMLIAEKLK